MVYRICLLCFLMISPWFCLSQGDFLLGGIQINEKDQKVWVNTLKKTGFNTVEVTVYAKQGNWNSDNLWWEEKDTAIVHEIRAAKQIGLNVVLILRVALDHAFEENQFLWHGMIMPGNDSLLTNWFWRYRRFSAFWAQIAQKEDVDVFVIGSEMNALSSTLPIDSLPVLEEFYLNHEKQRVYNTKIRSFENELESQSLWKDNNYNSLSDFLNEKSWTYRSWAMQTTGYPKEGYVNLMNDKRKSLHKHWVSVIDTVKAHFSGKTSYAANFDNYMAVGFWDKLDYMGINAYFPLRKFSSSEAMSTEIHNSWVDIFNSIESFQKNQNIDSKPILFTELGYTFRKNCSIEPWNSAGFSALSDTSGNEKLFVWDNQPNDYKERSVIVEELHHAVRSKNYNLKGILYWKLSTHAYHSSIEPFMLHINESSKDPLQKKLVSFLEN